MARRKKNDGSVLEGLVDLASVMPWWVGVVLADRLCQASEDLAGVTHAGAEGFLGEQWVGSTEV